MGSGMRSSTLISAGSSTIYNTEALGSKHPLHLSGPSASSSLLTTAWRLLASAPLTLSQAAEVSVACKLCWIDERPPWKLCALILSEISGNYWKHPL